MENTSITTKYVRKPLYVDAVQVTEQNFADIARWCFGEIGNTDESPVDRSADFQPTRLKPLWVTGFFILNVATRFTQQKLSRPTSTW